MRAWLLAVAVAACGSSSMQTTDGPATGGSDSGVDSPIPPGWTTLIDAQWQLAPAGTAGDEIYWCHRMKVTQDVWISGFRALAPAGTHHAVLTIDPTTTQTGQFSCDNSIGFDQSSRLVYASGLSTNDLVFPTGIAVHLTAGQYITLNLHLANVSDNARMDTSGVLVQTIPQSQVVHEIDATFAGTRSITLDPGQTPVGSPARYVVGGCSAPVDWHVFAVWPHMHQFGVHAKLLDTNNANVTTAVLDQPFDFTAEKTYPMNETVIHAGDGITARCDYQIPVQTCTYPTGACTYGSCGPDGYCQISYGETAGGEMCYVAMYKYPAGDVPAYGCHN